MNSDNFVPTIGFDVGNNYSACAIVEHGTTGKAVHFHAQVQLPSAVLKDGDKIHVGQRALDLAYRGDLYTDKKKLLPISALEPVRPDGLSPADWLTHIVGELRQAAVQSSDTIAKALDCGEYRLVVTLPYFFGEAEKNVYIHALEAMGLTTHSFMPEPQAAAWYMKSQYPDRIRHGDVLGCFDGGSSTTDFGFLTYSNGGFSQVAADAGVPIGGVDYTGVLFHHYCDQLGLSHLKPFYVPEVGFKLEDTELSKDDLRDALKLIRAAEDNKVLFCNTGATAESFVELSSGIAEVSCDRDTATQLWEPLTARIVDCFAEAVDALPPEHRPKLLCCVGGAIGMPDLIPRLALAACIDEQHTLIARDSATAIALGAVEAAASGFSGVSILNRALGVRAKDHDSGEEFVKVLVEEGRPIPPSGLHLETDSLFIKPRNGRATLALDLCELQPGMETREVAGHTVVPFANTSALGVCRFDFSDLQDDRIQVHLQFSYKDKIPSLVVRLIGTDIEPQHASILDDGKLSDETVPHHQHFILLCDVSSSMGKDGIEQVQRGIKRVVPKLVGNNVRVSLVVFGSNAKILLSNSGATSEICDAVDSLVSKGSTNMTDGLETARSLIDPNCRNTVLCYSDGRPNSAPKAMKAANTLRQHVDRVVTFGIGPGADHDLMQMFIASTPDDHVDGELEDFPLMISTVVDLYLLPARTPETEMAL